MGHSLIDRDQATRHQAAEPAGYSERTSGLLVVGVAMLAFVVCVTTFALGEARVGIVAAIVALLAFGAGLSWLGMDRRRVRDAERDLTVRRRAA